LRERVGERVSPPGRLPKGIKGIEPSPAALFERIDLSRKRERCREPVA
jgi:hypothetical protein